MTDPQLTAEQALERLKAGNARFAADARTPDQVPIQQQRQDLVGGQQPFAVVLGCSDSRVPAEEVFDCRLGELFVVRIAGNIAAPAQIGSVEFAVSKFGTRLVVVLGHSHCGAVQATLDAVGQGQDPDSPNLRAIVDSIRPAVASLASEPGARDPGTLMRDAVRANVARATAQLRQDSSVIDGLAESDGLVVVGAEYSLESGLVEFFPRRD